MKPDRLTLVLCIALNSKGKMIAYQINNGFPKRRQRSPLEENVWLMPAGCTDVEPPEFNASSHTCSFDGNQWIVAEISAPEPEPTKEPLSAIEQLRMQRNALIAETDWRMLPDYPGANQTEWQTYRQALRDMTTQSPSLDENGQLTGITWPTPPSND